MGLTRPRAYQIYDLDYKQAVRAVTTTDVSLSGGAPSQVDGVNLNLNDRVLVTGNDPASENGLYYVTTVGSGSNGTWQRSVDGNETGEIQAGLIVMVTEGTAYADTQWKLTTNDPITIGVSSLTFILNVGSIVGGLNTQVQYNAGGVLAGSANLTFDGSNLTVGGNISGSYLLGNGSQITGLPAGYANSNVVSYGETGWAGNLIPSANITYSLGNTTNRWKDLWISNSTIYIGETNISATGTTLQVNGSNVVVQTASGNISATYFIGNGSALTSITGANVTGTVANATYAISTGTATSATSATTAGTVTTNAQPNITSVGTLSSLSVTGNITGGNLISNGLIVGNGSALTSLTGANVTGTVANATYATSAGTATSATTAGTVTTATQPNITSVGTLSSLSVTGNVTGGNLVTSGLVVGNGSTLTSITGANVTGTVANATYATSAGSATSATTAGTVTTAAQPNITSVGTLSGLSVTGNINSGNLITGGLVVGNGSTLTSLTGANVTGTVANATTAGTVTTNAQPNITSVGTLSSLSVTGNITGGNLNIGSGLLTSGPQNITGDVNVTGNVIVTGNLNYANVTDLVVGDPLIYVGANNSANVWDLGMVVAWNDGTYQHGGWVRDASDGTWKLFGNVVEEPTTTIDFTNAIYQPMQSGPITAIGNISATYFIGNGSTLTSITGANVTGTVANATYATSAGSATSATTAGTVTTNAQPNITSVGTLSSLSVTGNVIGGNISTSGLVVGNGSALTNLTGANVTGTVANATYATTAGTVTTAAQPNITSVGTLSSLSVTGNVTSSANISGNYILGNGSQLTGLPATYGNSDVSNYLDSGINSANIVTLATISGAYIVGNGSALTSLTGANVTGTVANATYATSAGSATTATSATSATTAGTVTTASQPNITSVGTLSSLSVTGNITGGNLISNGLVVGNGSALTSLTGANVTGTVASATYANSAGTATSATTAGTVTTAAQPNITSVGTLSSLSVTGNISGGNLLGTLYTNNIVNSGANSTGNIGSSTTYFNTAFVKATSAQYADLAEMYVSDGYYPPGHIVVFGGDKEITLSTNSHDTAVAGIISTNPSYLMNSTQDGEFVLAVALTGRVPCLVQGPVNKGDVLVSGSAPGTAQRIGINWQPGCTVGKAMENIDTNEIRLIEVAVGRL